MTIINHETVIHLVGDCPLEEAEELLGLLMQAPGRAVDLTRAGSLHSAVFQVIFIAGATVIGPPGEAFLATWLWRFLRAAEP